MRVWLNYLYKENKIHDQHTKKGQVVVFNTRDKIGNFLWYV